MDGGRNGAAYICLVIFFLSLRCLYISIEHTHIHTHIYWTVFVLKKEKQTNPAASFIIVKRRAKETTGRDRRASAHSTLYTLSVLFKKSKGNFQTDCCGACDQVNPDMGGMGG